MASDFKILIHKNSESLHLKLMGDFDSTSAHELFDTIKDNGSKMNKIFIHTNGLRSICPFDKTSFQNHFFTINNLSTNVIFTGDYANQLAPEERGILCVS